jgi:feruloyl esterase
MRLCVIVTVLVASVSMWTGTALATTRCEDLAKLSLAHTTITSATSVAAGKFVPPTYKGSFGAQTGAIVYGQVDYARLPAFCQVMARLHPTTDSDITIEMWLPDAARWNGKLRGVQGQFVEGLASSVSRGYAAAEFNPGDLAQSIEHPARIADYGWRAPHAMNVAARALTSAFYGKTPQRVITAGPGGQVGLSAAQRFAEDYDAVAVTNLTAFVSRHTLSEMWMWYATHQEPGGMIPIEKYATIHRAALEACDANDGLKDGLIGDVLGCKFDPGALQCRGTDQADCLTAPQVVAARKLYAGPRNPRTGEELYSPVYPGSELEWEQMTGGKQPNGMSLTVLRQVVFKDPKWDYAARPLNFDSDLARIDRPHVQEIDAVDPDLRKYFSRGGKLLLIGGWADAGVPPKGSISYYQRVVATVGSKLAAEGMRFFLVPGMGHTPGVGTKGEHGFTFDSAAIIEAWKDTGKAPDHLIVTHLRNGREVRKRLVCQYPQVAMYKGAGDTEDPASFACK